MQRVTESRSAATAFEPSSAARQADAGGYAFLRNVKEAPLMCSSKVRVGLSKIKTPKGARMGLFSRGIKRGETICKISGPIAMKKTIAHREKRKLVKKTQEWLYFNRRACGMKRSSNIIYSQRKVPVIGEKEVELELGVLPCNLMLFANDSGNDGNPNLKVETSADIPEEVKQRKRALLPKEYPEFYAVAMEDIPEGMEITWPYGDGADPVDYEHRNQIPFDQDRDEKMIRNHTGSVIPCSMPLTVTGDISQFYEDYWNDLLEPPPFEPRYTPEESELLKKYSTKSELFIKGAINHSAMAAYIKLELSMDRSLNESLRAIRANVVACLKKGIQVETLPEVKQSGKVSLAGIYRYCHDKGILNPFEHHYSPLSWLAEELRAKPEDGPLIELLAMSIRSQLVKKRLHPSAIIGKLNTYKVPNPVRPSEKWSLFDLKNLGGIPANLMDEDDKQEMFMDYTLAHSAVDFTKVPVLAQCGDFDAILAFVTRKIYLERSLKETSDCMNKLNIPLFVDEEYVDATPEKLEKFVREHIHEIHHDKFLGLRRKQRVSLIKRDRQEVLKKSRVLLQKVEDKAAVERLRNRIKKATAERTNLKPSQIIRMMIKSALLAKPDEEYCSEDIIALFEGCEDPWLKEMFPILNLPDESGFDTLMDSYFAFRAQGVIGPNKERNAILQKLMELCRASEGNLVCFAKRRIAESKMPANNAYTDLKKLLDRHGVKMTDGRSYSVEALGQLCGRLTTSETILKEEFADESNLTDLMNQYFTDQPVGNRSPRRIALMRRISELCKNSPDNLASFAKRYVASSKSDYRMACATLRKQLKENNIRKADGSAYGVPDIKKMIIES